MKVKKKGGKSLSLLFAQYGLKNKEQEVKGLELFINTLIHIKATGSHKFLKIGKH